MHYNYVVTNNIYACVAGFYRKKNGTKNFFKKFLFFM